MEVGKGGGRDRNGSGWDVGVAVDFGGLARYTRAAPIIDVGGHFGPEKSSGDKAAGRAYTGVGESVNVGENGVSQGSGNKRAENTGRCVAMEGCAIDVVCNGGEGGVREKFGCVGAFLLSLR